MKIDFHTYISIIMEFKFFFVIIDNLTDELSTQGFVARVNQANRNDFFQLIASTSCISNHLN